MPKKSSTVAGLLKKLAFYLALIVLWEMVYRVGIFPDNLFPSPGRVLHKIATGFKDSTFLDAVRISMQRITVGYLISLPIGLVLGLVVGQNRFLNGTLSPILLGLQSLPNVCWVPLAVFWFGLGNQSILFVIIVSSVFSVSLAVISGLQNIPPIYTRLAQTMGAKGFTYYSTVLVPAALPSIVGGMKQGWSFAWRGLIAGELLAPKDGLGYILHLGKNADDMNMMVAVMIIIILLGVLVDYLVFNKMETKIRYRWGLIQA